jgi:hypothetical protein
MWSTDKHTSLKYVTHNMKVIRIAVQVPECLAYDGKFPVWIKIELITEEDWITRWGLV